MTPKPLYVSLAVCVVLIALVSWILPKQAAGGLRKASTEIFSPIWRTTDWFKNKADLAKRSLQTIEDLEDEVGKLRKERASLATENAQFRKLRDENARLREMLGFANDSPFRLLACRVIQRDPSNWWSAVIINRGWADDEALAPDQPVISPRGVVGKTGRVGRYATRVILLVDENCKVSAEVENTGARGVVMGDASSNLGDAMCRITFVSRDAELPVGARVFTSGLGGNFPQGLFLGTVEKVHPLRMNRNFGLFQDGVVRPALKLDDLKELFVIVGMKK